GQANLTDPSVNERFSIDKFPECFAEYADMLSWDQYWHTTLDTSKAPFWKWFVGGKLNACYNCVDRHLPRYGNKAALIFVPEPEDAALSRQRCHLNPDGRGSRLRPSRGHEGIRRTKSCPSFDAGGITALSDVHEWNDRETEGLPA